MKDFFTTIPKIGSVTIEHVFYEYKKPTLFVLKDRNQTRYLCSCCKLDEEWLVAQISTRTLIDLIDNKITLADVFKTANNKLPLSWDDENLTIQPRIEPDMYPAPNTRLDLSNQKDAKQYKTYLQTVALSHKPQ